jgi:hypothetical protein
MPMTSRWGQQNPLVRRVQQHGAFTTLFRSPAAPVTSRLAPMPFVLGQLAPPTVAVPMAETGLDALSPVAPLWPTPVAEAPTVEGVSQLAPTAGQIVASVAAVTQRAADTAPSASLSPSPVQRTPHAPPAGTVAPIAETAHSALPTIGVFSPLTPATPMATPLVAAARSAVQRPGVATPALIPAQPGAVTPPAQGSVATATVPVQPHLALSAPTSVAPSAAVQGSVTTAVAQGQPHPVVSAPSPIEPSVTGQPGSTATTVAATPQAAAAAVPWPEVAAPASVQRQVEPVATPSDGIDERTWSRLQSAFRKAKAQASESGSPALPLSTAAASKRPPVAPVVAQRQPERSPLRRTTISEQSAGRPLPSVLPTDDASAPTTSPVRNLPADQTSVTTSSPVLQRSLASPPVGEAQASTEDNPPSVPLAGLNTSLQPPEDAPAPVHSFASLPSGEATPSTLSITVDSVLPPVTTMPAVVQRTTAPLPPTDAPMSPPQLASLPSATVAPPETEWMAATQPDPVPGGPLALEAVWPVQRLPAVTTSTDAPTPAAGAPTGFVAPVEAPPPVLTDTVRQQLETTHTARPTDSKVDILMPRRPRPVLRSSAQTVETTGVGTLLQRQLDETASTAPAASEQQLDATQPALVPTEIGPLPADLWQLIGAQPPAPSPTVPTAAPVNAQLQVPPTVTQPQDSVNVPAVQRAPVAHTPLQASASAPTAAPVDLPGPLLQAEPTGDEAVPGQLSSPTGYETIATSMAAPTVYTPSATILATVPPPVADGVAAVDKGAMTQSSAAAATSAPVAVIPGAALEALGSSPASVVTNALQLQPITTAPPVSTPTNPVRPSAPPVLVTQQAPPSVLRQAEPPMATPVTTGSAPAATSKKKRRRRSTPTK